MFIGVFVNAQILDPVIWEFSQSKISESDKKKIEQDLEELKKVKDSDDLEAIKTKTEQLVQSSLKLGEAIYKQNPQNQAPQPDSSGTEPSSNKKEEQVKDEKVVDADFEEVDDNNFNTFECIFNHSN